MTVAIGRAGLFAGVVALLSFSVLPAHAQHVVTDEEAAKLTFEALTAPPPRPVYHPVYRAYLRPAAAWHLAHGRWHAGRRAVMRASYHTEAVRHVRRRRR